MYVWDEQVERSRGIIVWKDENNNNEERVVLGAMYHDMEIIEQR